VGPEDALVDEARRLRVLVEGQLAGGEHDLALRAVDDVAVGVDVEEVVVAADPLELVERRAERPVVPQPGVGEVSTSFSMAASVSASSPRKSRSSQSSMSNASRVIEMLLLM
jgi:hypothetical protein